MARRFLLERPHVVHDDFALSNVLVTHQQDPGTPQSYSTVFLNAGILALPGESVTGEIPRICRGFSLVDRADQTEEIPCLTAYWMSWALVFTFSCSIIRDLWYSIVLRVR